MGFTRPLIFFEALCLTMFVFGLLLWGYVVVIQVTRPQWLAESLTHHTYPPLNWRVNDLGILGFVAALLGFFMRILGLGYNTDSISRHGKS